MPFRRDPVLDALDRWEAKGLLDGDRAAVLRDEAEEEADRSGRRFSQFVLAGAGAVVLLVAAGVLGDWLWPRMGVGTRSFVLAAVGVGVHGLGLRIEGRVRWRPAAWLLQTAGLLVLLGAFAYSGQRWPDASAGGVAVGILALAVPVVTAPRTLGRNAVMPAVHLVVGLGFLAVFLDRSTPLGTNDIVWVLDGVLLLATAVLVLELGRRREPGEVEWRLNAFAAAVYAGGFLVFATALGPLGWEADAVWALDAWLLLATALTLAGIHLTPPRLRRSWFDRQLGGCVLLAIPLAFATCQGALEWSATPTALVVGLVGAAGLAYGVPRSVGAVVRAGAAAVVVAAWYLGVEQGGALGAVLALAFTAALLFWLSGRVGREHAPE